MPLASEPRIAFAMTALLGLAMEIATQCHRTICVRCQTAIGCAASFAFGALAFSVTIARVLQLNTRTPAGLVLGTRFLLETGGVLYVTRAVPAME